MLVEKVKETLEGGLPPSHEEAMAAREDSAPGVWVGSLLEPGLGPPGTEEVSLASLGGAYFHLLMHEASSARCPPPHRAQRRGWGQSGDWLPSLRQYVHQEKNLLIRDTRVAYIAYVVHLVL